MLNACNPYFQVFRQVRDIINTNNVHDMGVRIISARPGGNIYDQLLMKLLLLLWEVKVQRLLVLT